MSHRYVALEKALASRSRLSLSRPKAAAVLLPILSCPLHPPSPGPPTSPYQDPPLSLLFTRRSHQISQGGQIAFPGGKVERSDEDRTATAVRETHEEIGLPPESLRVVGLLDDIPNYDNTQSVTPVVAVVDPAFDTANLIKSPEVSAIFSVPVPDLEKDENWTTKEMEWKGHQVTQFFFDCRAYPSAGTGEALWCVLIRVRSERNTAARRCCLLLAVPSPPAVRRGCCSPPPPLALAHTLVQGSHCLLHAVSAALNVRHEQS
jgi:8-oxo-dGTP pyrophosphatase MutT (NUDIX family)